MRNCCLLPGLVLILLFAVTAQAQPTRLDPSYPAHRIYQPATVEQAMQLTTGERVLLGKFRRANGQPAGRLLRYTAAGAPDLAFQSTVAAYDWNPTDLAEDSGGRLLVSLQGACITPTQTYHSVVRLLPSGAIDASFAVQPATADDRIYSLLRQADGKVLLAGAFTSYGTETISGLLRLNADGTLDRPYLANLGGGLINAGPPQILPVLGLQADGKLLVGGAFVAVGTQPIRALARLNADGTLDSGFASPPIYPNTAVASLAVVPGGGLIIAGGNYQPVFSNPTRRMARLTASGALDATFTTVPYAVVENPYFGIPNLVVQPDGKVLYYGETSATTAGPARLLATGGFDPAWTAPAIDATTPIASLQLLPSGELLTAGPPVRAASATALPTPVMVLSSNGAYVPGFAPVLQTVGRVGAVAMQPDGKLVIGGDFSEINGNPARNLARLNLNGTVDVAFTAAAPAAGQVRALVLQPDGKVLVGGAFDYVAGQPLPALVRLLPSGAPDPAFALTPALLPTAPGDESSVDHLALQPDGQVLASAHLRFVGSARTVLFPRFSASGQIDGTFRQQAAIDDAPFALLVQPDSKIVVSTGYSGGLARTPSLLRLLPDGSIDPAFTNISYGGALVESMARYPDGRLLVGGYLDSLGMRPGVSGIPSSGVARLLANGTPDPTFESGLTPGYDNEITSLLLQPNGRVLLGGAVLDAGASAYSALGRVLPNGGPDPGFDPTDLPTDGVAALALQPDGAIIVAGSFEKAGTQTRYCLIRLLDPNVLTVGPQQANARTNAYPVPAHHQLHLSLDAASHPKQIQLLDVLGRSVLTQAEPAAETTLNTTSLLPGVYLLQVHYATGETVTRRVVRE